MAAGPQFRDSVLAAKERLTEGRETLRAQHAMGTSGSKICARMAEVLDRIVIDLFQAALADLELESLRDKVALIPHGGTGRRDVAPYSDLDLMILYQGAKEEQIAPLAKRIMQDLYDAGLHPGHSVRTPTQAVQLARDDTTICTSLIESRFLIGEKHVYDTFRESFKKMTERRYRNLHESIILARRQERLQFGETVYLLTPNVKRTRGGLREIQLLRWIGFCRFGSSDPDQLLLDGALSEFDYRRLTLASEFLLRLRNEMHFAAGRAQDVLERQEQLRVAEAFGYRGTAGSLPVEQFMQEYFRHTRQVRNLVSRFVHSVAPRPSVLQSLKPAFSHLVEGDYRVDRSEISATSAGLEKLKTSLDEVLRLTDLANQYNVRITHSTWNVVAKAAPKYSDEMTDEVAKRFLSLLGAPAQLGVLLRRLHELRVLEKIIPQFGHAWCLLQFNEYHQYTVDEHSFRAVDAATELLDVQGPLGDAYRGIKQKRTLHLALLIHDLGKGYEEDHSELGLKIAEETGQRLGLSTAETDAIKFLVHKHLAMAHLAFRRDTSDPQVVVRFAVEVGSPELLQMLFVLTCADLAAVGPGVLNDWKIEVLANLYFRALRHLTGSEAGKPGDWLQQRRGQVRELTSQGEAAQAHIDALPVYYLETQTPENLAALLDRVCQLPPSGAIAWGEFHPDTGTMQYTVVVDQGHGRGVFSRLAGALTSQRLKILSAEINSLDGDVVLDTFVVHDPDYQGPPPADRIEQASRALVESVATSDPPTFRAVWGKHQQHTAAELSDLSTRIQFDNSTSEQHTILEIFTFDQIGLLYTIARTLFELKLSIGVARIGTYLDQVVDVFYVTEQGAGKVEGEARLEEIRQRLLDAIRENETET